MNKPIKILVHGMTGNPGGMESCIMNYYRNISPEKIQFDFLGVNQEPVYRQEIVNRNSKVYLIPGRRRYDTHCRELNAIFKENRYDGLWSNRCSLPGTVPLFKIARKHNVPLRILHAHNTNNMTPGVSSKIFHEIDKYRIEKYTTDYWACSDKAGEYFFNEKAIKSPLYRIINNAIDADKFKFDGTVRDNTRKALKLDGKLVIGHVGRFHFQKNHQFLMRVFHEIYKKEPNAALLLIGDGELRPKIENMTKSLNLTGAVHFLGARYDIPALLNAMDVQVFPSKFEGLGISLIEAQAASLHSFASTEVPKEAKITGCLSFVELKKSPAEWAKLILAKRNYKREDTTEEIRKAGYDIKTEAAKLEQYLIDRSDSIHANN